MYVVACAALALALEAQTDLPREVLLLSKIRHRAVEDLSHMPNFTCLETIERATRRYAWNEFSLRDVVQVEVAHVGTEELFSWPGAAHFESRTLADMVGSGLVSNGEYVGRAGTVFIGDAGVIRYWGEEDLEGHRAARYDYRIATAFAGNKLIANHREAYTGVRGSFWADTGTLDLLRLTAEATEIPSELGVESAVTEVDYSRIPIGSGEFLLPQSARTWLVHSQGFESRNRIDFTHCRQYATESVLSFEETGGTAYRGSKGISDFVLPSELVCPLRLEKPVDLATAKGGDAVSALLDADLKRKKQVLAPKGAVVSGRIRMLRKDSGGYAVALEFTDLTFEGKRARFIAKLVSVDSHLARQLRSSSGADVPPDASGIGTFFVDGHRAELPKGMAMEWKTLGIEK